jgi:hypothetical protein
VIVVVVIGGDGILHGCLQRRLSKVLSGSPLPRAAPDPSGLDLGSRLRPRSYPISISRLEVFQSEAWFCNV